MSGDEEVIYIHKTNWTANSTLYQYTIRTNETIEIETASEIGIPDKFNGFTGYDAWDQHGRFYYVETNPRKDVNGMNIGIDPVRFKVNKGILPYIQVVAHTI